MTPFARRLADKARSLGCSKVSFDWSRKHPRLIAEFNGVTIIHIFSGTYSGNGYGGRAAMAHLRRQVRAISNDLDIRSGT